MLAGASVLFMNIMLPQEVPVPLTTKLSSVGGVAKVTSVKGKSMKVEG